MVLLIGIGFCEKKGKVDDEFPQIGVEFVNDVLVYGWEVKPTLGPIPVLFVKGDKNQMKYDRDYEIFRDYSCGISGFHPLKNPFKKEKFDYALVKKIFLKEELFKKCLDYCKLWISFTPTVEISRGLGKFEFEKMKKLGKIPDDYISRGYRSEWGGWSFVYQEVSSVPFTFLHCFHVHVGLELILVEKRRVKILFLPLSRAVAFCEGLRRIMPDDVDKWMGAGFTKNYLESFFYYVVEQGGYDHEGERNSILFNNMLGIEYIRNGNFRFLFCKTDGKVKSISVYKIKFRDLRKKYGFYFFNGYLLRDFDVINEVKMKLKLEPVIKRLREKFRNRMFFMSVESAFLDFCASKDLKNDKWEYYKKHEIPDGYLLVSILFREKGMEYYILKKEEFINFLLGIFRNLSLYEKRGIGRVIWWVKNGGKF